MRRNNAQKTYLIVRLSSLSDVIIASPFAKLLKEHYPDSKVVWITQPENAAPLINNPYIDRIIFWDKQVWLRSVKQLNLITLYRESKKLRKELQKENIDTAFDLQGLFKSGFIAWLSGAQKRIGVGSREGSYWFMDKMVSTGMINRNHLGADYRYLATQLGLNDQSWQVENYTQEKDEEYAAKIKASRIRPDEPYAVVCPYASKETKAWPQSYWQQLILRLRGRYQLKTILLGHETDAKYLESAALLEKTSGAINFFGSTSLHEATSIIQQATLVVGVDNGLTHISQSLDMPSVMLLGGSLPYLYTDQASSKAIHMGKYCSPCNHKPMCNDRLGSMADITPDQVLTELRQLFRRAEHRNPAA
jgi:heptosyltransferase-1